MNFIDRWIVERQMAQAKKRPRQGFKPANFQGGSLFLPSFIGAFSPGGGGGGGGVGLTLFDSLANNVLIVTGTVETQFYSKSIPGNTIGAGKGFRIIHRLTAVDSATGNTVLTVNIKMDGVTQFAVSITISETAGVPSIVTIDHYLLPYTAGGNNQIWSLIAISVKSSTLNPSVRMWSNAVASTFDMTTAHTLSATVINQLATGSAYHEFTTMELLQV